MRRLVAVGAGTALAVRVVRRRMHEAAATVVVGFADGSTVELDRRHPQRERMVDVARAALTR